MSASACVLVLGLCCRWVMTHEFFLLLDHYRLGFNFTELNKPNE